MQQVVLNQLKTYEKLLNTRYTVEENPKMVDKISKWSWFLFRSQSHLTVDTQATCMFSKIHFLPQFTRLEHRQNVFFVSYVAFGQLERKCLFL